MAASTSQQPQVSTPDGPKKTAKSAGLKKDKGKGKEEPKSQKRRARVQPPQSSSTGSLDPDLDWNWISLTESAPNKVPPVFTLDGRYFFSLSGSAVKIYSSSTGQVVSTLSSPRISGSDSSAQLTSVVLNPHNTFQLITGSMDGFIRIWDFLDATLLKTINVAQPILHLCAHLKFKDSVFVSTLRSSKKSQSDNGVVMRVSITTAYADPVSAVKPAETVVVGKTRFPTGLAVSPSGASLVATAGHKSYVADTSALHAGFTKYVSPERLTCLTFHPSEEYFATGDDKGVVRIWYCLAGEVVTKRPGLEKKTQTSSFHWHAHAVSSLSFTPNGAYLLSGGEESVLVVWQLHTGKREFVPRVGAPISTISVKSGDEQEYLLGLADSTYAFIGASTLKLARSFCRIKLDPISTAGFQSRKLSAPLAVHDLTSSLILPSSHPSSLQIYSPSSSKLISELEVSPSNRVSRRDEKPLEPAMVQTAVISPSGLWMATVDVRHGDDTFRGEIYLKLWTWDRFSSTWALNTRIDQPHGSSAVTHTAFSPDSSNLVTTGDDGQTKIWRLRRSRGKETTESWVARSSATFRSETPRNASWSQDGSLLAVSSGPYVTIYETSSNTLCRVLTSPHLSLVLAAHFVGRGSRFLAAVGSNDLVVWDLVSHSAAWHYRSSSPVIALVPHALTDTFALVRQASRSNETRISVFHPSSPKVTRTHFVPFGLLNVLWYSSNRSSSFAFVGISDQWKVVLFGDSIQKADDVGATRLSDSSLPNRTLFTDIFGKSAFAAGVESAPLHSMAAYQPAPPGTLSDAPSHTMPPIEQLYDTLMHSLLKPSTNSKPELMMDVDDVEIADQEEELPKKLGRSQLLSAPQLDMDTLVAMFKEQYLDGTPQKPRPSGNSQSSRFVPVPLTNGHDWTPSPSPPPPPPVTVQGAATVSPKVNGTTRATGMSKYYPHPVTPSPSPPSEYVLNMRKRKKSTN